MAAGLLAMTVAMPALAHEEDAERPAADLVRQAIALLATAPNDLGELREKLEAAPEAEDRSGVDLALVEQATQALFDDDDPHRARALLERAVGAQPHLSLEDPDPIRQTRPESDAPDTESGKADESSPPAPTGQQPMEMATGADPGATLIADPLDPRPRLDGTDWALLAGSLALGLTGLWLALRLRPAVAQQPRAEGPGSGTEVRREQD